MAGAAGDNAFSKNAEKSGTDEATDSMLIWKLSHKAWQTFNELRESELFFDVVLRTEDKVKHSAHKIVLCTCGEYFRTLFSGRWNCSNKTEIQLPGISSKVFSKILEFAYKRSVSLTSLSSAKELFLAANQLALDDIITICSNFIKNEVDVQNCLDIWIFSRNFFCALLEDFTLQFILKNFTEIVSLPITLGAIHFTKLSLDDFKSILQSDELFVDSENQVFQALMKWVNAQADRYMDLYEMIACVRLGFLPKNFLQSIVTREAAVRACPRTKRLISWHLEWSRRCKLRNICKIPSAVKKVFSGRTSSIIQQTLRPRYPRKLILVVGGWSGDSPTNITEAYNPLTESWFDISPSITPLLTRSRAYHGVVYNQGFMYMVGGFDGEVTYRSCDRFDMAQWKWTSMNQMHERRCYVATAMLNGHIYAIGGSCGDNRQDRLRSAEVFNTSLNSWTMLPEMSECRSDAGACAFGDRVYVVGGFTGHECVFSAEFFEPEIGQWTSITPMRIRRSGVSVLAYKNSILAIGGFDGHCSRLNSVERYNPSTNTWSSWSSMPNMLVGRSNFGACVVDGRIFAIGGFDGKATSAKVECYEEEESANEMRLSRGRGQGDSPTHSGESESSEDEDELFFPQIPTGSGDDERHLRSHDLNQGFCFPRNDDEEERRMPRRRRTQQSHGAWRHLPNMEIPRSALSCCVVNDLSPRYLQSIIAQKDN